MSEQPKLQQIDKLVDEIKLENARGKLLADTIMENAVLVNIPEKVKANMIELVESCTNDNVNVKNTISKLKRILNKYPELLGSLFKEKLEEAIVKKGFLNKKINPEKPDPLNEVWSHFFDLPVK